jgi:CDK inhibitor PHO81
VPSVIQGIKDTGLLVGTFGTTEETAVLSALAITESAGVDAVLGDGMLTCLEQSMRALL